MHQNYTLPPNVALITLQVIFFFFFFNFCDVHSTSEVYKFFLLLMFKLKLQEMGDGTVLLRLAHLYEVLDKWDKIILF